MKQIVALTVLLFASSFFGTAQENTFRISGSFQYDRTFTAPWDGNSSSNGIGPGGCYAPLSLYPSRLTYTAGIAANYQLNSHVEFFTGLNFSRKLGYYYPYWIFGCGDGAYPIYQCLYAPYSFQNFVEVPLGARFYMLPGNFKMHVELAQITSIPLAFNDPYFESNLLLTGRIGYGLDYYLGPWQWSLNVNYGRIFQPIQRNAALDWSQNNLGFEIRTAFRLGSH